MSALPPERVVYLLAHQLNRFLPVPWRVERFSYAAGGTEPYGFVLAHQSGARYLVSVVAIEEDEPPPVMPFEALPFPARGDQDTPGLTDN